MNYKVGYDRDFYCKFSIGEDDMLVNMFWRDGETLSNYCTFRLVLMFDSTFMTNVYQKPLVCFIGNDNHKSIVVFGFALLGNEMEQSYIWVSSTFLSSINDKMSIFVVTDGCEAMRCAIEVFVGG